MCERTNIKKKGFNQTYIVKRVIKFGKLSLDTLGMDKNIFYKEAGG